MGDEYRPPKDNGNCCCTCRCCVAFLLIIPLGGDGVFNAGAEANEVLEIAVLIGGLLINCLVVEEGSLDNFDDGDDDLNMLEVNVDLADNGLLLLAEEVVVVVELLEKLVPELETS